MRLTQIKLAGFKSFVDPTSIPTPSQLVGVVGPNGCGKSNIIDAVRWVLGESKASELRGESMQDVIFNGSSQRKPAGRASVELVFDNSEGRASGQWSTFGKLETLWVVSGGGNAGSAGEMASAGTSGSSAGGTAGSGGAGACNGSLLRKGRRQISPSPPRGRPHPAPTPAQASIEATCVLQQIAPSLSPPTLPLF